MQARNERDEQEVRNSEVAYRQGFAQGIEEATRLVLQLQELGYALTQIKRLLAVYDDHFISVWRQSANLDKREAPPPFDVNRCQAILAGTTGYNWIV